MIRRTLFLSLLVLTLAGSSAARPAITLDYSEAPELKDWAEKARGLCEQWYPKIAASLKVSPRTPARPVRIVFKRNMRGIAGTSGSTISVSARWLKEHPDDFGMVIHELTHVVQAYPPGGPGWLVEGIADYVRFREFEPNVRLPRVSQRASYRDGYRTTAAFLAWVEQTYDPRLIPTLNDALHSGTYTDDLFRRRTGKDLDRLWAEFVASQAHD